MTTPDDTAFLRIQGVSKDFAGHRAVADASVDVVRGEIFALLGPSGCGKSTLLRMLAGFETPTSGRITLGGVDLATLPPYRRPINMMFQSYALFPHLDVRRNIAFGLEREGMAKDSIAERVDAMLKLVQLTPYGRRKPHQLSGGQQQRVALARSLARQPQLLLLDEPLGALDKKLREQTQIELVEIIRGVGVTCVMVTHDQEEAMTMATRIAVMNEGRLLQVGAPGAVYEAPASRFVADFIGNVNLMPGTVADAHTVDSPDCRHRVEAAIATAPGSAVTVALRPEKIRLARDEPANAFNRLRGTVRDVAYFGSYTVLHLLTASGATLKVNVANVDRDPGAAPVRGDALWARWAANAHVVLTS